MGTKISQLEQAPSFLPSDYLPLDNGQKTRKLPMGELFPNTPAAHNNRIRGKVLTDHYTLAQILAMVAARDYHDIFAGDKIVLNVPAITATGFAGGSTEFTVAEIESHHHYGDSEPLTNVGHLLMVPSGILGSAHMNATNTTEGGYDGSDMDNTILPAVQTALETAFGAEHLKNARELLTNTVNTTFASKAGANWMGAATNHAWADRKLRLMTELEVYGGDVCSSSAYDSMSGLAHQIALFRMDRAAVSIRASWWLSAVAGSSGFALVGNSGFPYCHSASRSDGVRPRFIIG